MREVMDTFGQQGRDPQVGSPVADLVGRQVEIASDSGARAAQVAASLKNSGIEVAMSVPQSPLAADFHKAAAPEQPRFIAAARVEIRPANIMTRDR